MVVPPEVDTKNLYFYEQDRIDSFKSWPFGGKQICNPIRVCLFIYTKLFNILKKTDRSTSYFILCPYSHPP